MYNNCLYLCFFNKTYCLIPHALFQIMCVSKKIMLFNVFTWTIQRIHYLSHMFEFVLNCNLITVFFRKFYIYQFFNQL